MTTPQATSRPAIYCSRWLGWIGVVIWQTSIVSLAFWQVFEVDQPLLVDGIRPTIDTHRPPDAESVGNDLTTIHLPNQVWLVRQYRETGRFWPSTWDPIGFAGRPRWSNPQSGLFYPPRWLTWVQPSPTIWTWLTLAHLIWGGIGSATLLRTHGCSWWTSCVASVGFPLAPYVLGQVAEGHLPHVWSAMWFPWTFVLADRLRHGQMLGWGLPLVLGLAISTGHPQEALWLGLTLGGWAMFDLVGRRPGCWRWPVAGALSLGLTIPIWGPTVQSWPHFFEWSIIHEKACEIKVENLVQIFNPRGLGSATDYLGSGNVWESMIGSGWGLGAAFWMGVVLGRSARERFWLVLGAVALLVALGDCWGLTTLLDGLAVPSGLIRVPARALFLETLSVATLAGFGLDRLSRGQGPAFWHRPTLRRLASVLMGISIGLVAISAWIERGDIAVLDGQVCLTDPLAIGVWSGIAMIMGLGLFTHRVSFQCWIAPLLGSILIAEATIHANLTIPVAPASRFFGPNPITKAIQGRVTQAKLGESGRIRVQDALYTDLDAAIAGLEKTNVNDLYQLDGPARQCQILYPMFRPERLIESERVDYVARCQHVLDRWGVRWIVSDRPMDDSDWPWERVDQGFWDGRNYWVYENLQADSQAYFVDNQQRKCFLKLERPHPDLICFAVFASGPGLISVAESWHPGWRATLNGESVQVDRSQDGMLEIVIEQAGLHQVRLAQ